MAIAAEPEGFAGGLAPPDGSSWTIFGESYSENPRLTLPREVWPMIHLWKLYRGSGMSVGFLPDAGGTLDQSTYMLTAFSIMSGAYARWEEERRERMESLLS